jgi:hypothetical protein
MQKWGERIFSKQQLGKRVYIGKVMIMVLEYLSLPHQKLWFLRA